MSRSTVSSLDVAKYILNKLGTVSAMKLQKLVYYSQAWALVWDEKALFDDRIEAWVSGPVIPILYQKHRGEYILASRSFRNGDTRKLSKPQKETIDAVLKFYGKKDSQWLSDLTHLEKPWRKARKGLSTNERGNTVITLASMSAYYSSL